MESEGLFVMSEFCIWTEANGVLYLWFVDSGVAGLTIFTLKVDYNKT